MMRRSADRDPGPAGGCGGLRGLLQGQEGAALIEFTLLAPFLFSLVLGMAEFGRFLYQYQMVIEGLRDAGRYLARLDPNDATNQGNAANLATTGTIDGTGDPRVDGWEAGDVLFSVTDVDNTAGTYRGGAEIEVIEVTTTFDYADVGFLSALGFDPISIAAAHEQRVILE
jgi:Flp pilus assembly protein TadG